MLIKRPAVRRAARVAESWGRIERWCMTHAPEIIETLRQGATDEQIAAFEAAMFIQTCPAYYDPARDRIAEVRQVAPDELLVYMEPVDGKTVRYHLVRTADQWLIDFKDETVDQVTFSRRALLFGAE